MTETLGEFSDKSLKVAFFGTSDRSIPILEALNKNFDLQLCVTKNDTKVGRKQITRETGVKKWAKKNSIKVITVTNLKSYDLEGVIESLKYANIQYCLVADFSFIIPQEIISYFNGNLINIHFSLLPLYRGASPVQFALLNGDETTGITYYLVDNKLDAGKIIHQIGYKITTNLTSGQLWEILFDIAAINLPEVVFKFSKSQLVPRQQDENKISFTYSPSHPKSTFIFKEDAQINWKKDSTQIERGIRAFNPWPVSWTYLKDLENNKKLANSKLKLKKNLDKNQTVKIFSATVDENKLLTINELQIQGKNKMDWKSFINGYEQLKQPKKPPLKKPVQRVDVASDPRN